MKNLLLLLALATAHVATTPFAAAAAQTAPAPQPAALSELDIRDAYHKSYRYERSQNYTDAIKALSPVIIAFPQAYTVNLRLGWLNYLIGSYATARTHYLTAIKTAPDSLEAKLGHTLPLLAQERYDEAEIAAKQVLRIDPSNYLANLRLAFAFRMLKKFEAAEDLLNRMLVLYPTDVSLLTEYALVKLAKNQNPDAKRIFNDILTLDPENVIAKAQLSKL